MKKNRSERTLKAFTLIELLIVVLILGILTTIGIPSFLTAVTTSREGTANSNARALAMAVQARAVISNAYDTNIGDYTADMGGAIPVNPCTGTTSGYSISISGTTSVSVSASAGTNCGTWTPMVFSLNL